MIPTITDLKFRLLGPGISTSCQPQSSVSIFINCCARHPGACRFDPHCPETVCANWLDPNLHSTQDVEGGGQGAGLHGGAMKTSKYYEEALAEAQGRSTNLSTALRLLNRAYKQGDCRAAYALATWH